MPKKRISLTQGSCILSTVVTFAQGTAHREPIRKQHDFLALIDVHHMPIRMSSVSHLCSNFCSSYTDGANNKISSAYIIIIA